MKQLSTLLLAFLASGVAISQTASAVVFSENGEKFTLILNGEKKNDTPSANVKLSGLTSEFYQARVDFEDPSLPDFTNKNFAVQPGSEVAYVIRTNKKGEYVMRFQGESVQGSTAATAPAGTTDDVRRYAIVTEETAPQETGTTRVTTTTPGTTLNQNISVTETTTTTTRPTGENVGINMNVGGVNMGVNVNVTGMDMDINESSTTTVTTTTRTTGTTTPAPAPAPTTRPAREEVVVKGCTRAMDRAAFDQAKKSVSDKGFEDTKLSTARQVAKNNCLTTAQIKEIMGVFGFEDSKLQFAKYAYDFCVDKGNYYLVGDAFGFSSSVDELNQFLESK